MKLSILNFLCILAFFSQFLAAQKIVPVSYVDLKRYSGLWYEIARLPTSTETHCIQNTNEYTITDRELSILKRCTKANGYTRESKGVAKINNAPSNSILSTNFVPNWLSWTGLGWEEYWIIDLDSNYQFAVISEPGQDYLWILSRKESIPQNTYNLIISKLRAQQFDLSRLIVSGKIIPALSNTNRPVALK